jgi:hypothetical protein
MKKSETFTEVFLNKRNFSAKFKAYFHFLGRIDVALPNDLIALPLRHGLQGEARQRLISRNS